MAHDRLLAQEVTATDSRSTSSGAALETRYTGDHSACYTRQMWILAAAAMGVLALGAAVWALVSRRGTDPAEGLSVSQAWIVSQRASKDSSE